MTLQIWANAAVGLRKKTGSEGFQNSLVAVKALGVKLLVLVGTILIPRAH